MLRKMFSLGALFVVAVTFGVGNAAANPGKPGKPGKPGNNAAPAGFSDGRYAGFGNTDGFSDGRI
jgi:hypothetical protein